MKENLFALCAFARMLLFVWNDRLQEGAGKEQDRASIFDKLKEQEQDMLKDFEHMMTRILARAATLLEPNSIELLLFASAHLLFGARVYLFLNDAILSRIQTLRESLSVQCRTWRQGKQSDNLLVYCDDESLGQLTSMRKKSFAHQYVRTLRDRSTRSGYHDQGKSTQTAPPFDLTFGYKCWP